MKTKAAKDYLKQLRKRYEKANGKIIRGMNLILTHPERLSQRLRRS